MGDSSSPTPELLQSVLEILLEDFEYWFARSRELLQNDIVSFISDQEQCDLLNPINQAQAELSRSKMLFTATGKQVGIN
ncbi:Protein of unknown function DUF2605 ['Nostoc azollae' 0708]|jgi:hypothetical protein|uniref:DUF2605 domain-containing protein n=1 Tax=Nostoc azollae (strain 0708) TaxID=551115 RepID=D7E0N0_NOSA0|nr:Protein of unknown function DUF2605 ['Nostoc azollae' 0708]